MLEDKYIKRINYPYVEIRDNYNGGGTHVINVEAIAQVYDRAGVYKHGILFKDGTWDENYHVLGLAELKEYLMTLEK